MRDAGARDLQTLTLSFGEFQGRPDDEAPLAAAVARHYDTRHTTRRVTAQEFHADLPLILAAMDQPSIDGINTWFIAKAARDLPLGNRAELTRWRHACARMFARILHDPANALRSA